MDQFDIMDKTLREIKENEDYSRLEDFKSPRKWGRMRDDQKEALALLFVRQGAKSLETDEKGKAFEAFSIAERLAPNSCEMYLLQTAALTKANLKNKYHLLALEKGKKALQLDPNSFYAHARLARTNLELGIQQQDYEFLSEADQLFAKACALRTSQNDPEGTLLWMWGTVWHEMGKLSGEAVDFTKALEKYAKADEEGLANPLFFNDYGNCLVELGKLLNQLDLFLDAIEKFQMMTVLDPRIYQGWLNIAFLCEKLLIMTDDEMSFFDEADYAYAKASEMESKDLMVWARWAQLLYFIGCRFQKPDLIGRAIGTFEKAMALEPNNAHLMAEHAEALAMFGACQEDIASLRLAEEKIAQAIQIDPKDPLKWYIYGKCLFELGDYFDDIKYYNLSAEKFIAGLEISKTHSVLWYGLAKCYYYFGVEQGDPSVLEQANNFFSRAQEFGGEMSGEFWSDWGKNWLKIAEIRRTKKAVKNAMEKFERSMELYKYPSAVEFVHPEALYFYAMTWCLLGELSYNEKFFFKSVDLLKHLLEIHPHFTLAHYNIALCFSHLGDLTHEIEFYERAMEFYTQYSHCEIEDDALWMNWGISYLRMLLLTYDPAHPEYNQKLVKEGEEKLLRAAFLGCPFAYYVLGCLHSKNQNYEVALDYLKKAHRNKALPPLSELRHDPWLADLREVQEFKDFLLWLDKNG